MIKMPHKDKVDAYGGIDHECIYLNHNTHFQILSISYTKVFLDSPSSLIQRVILLNISEVVFSHLKKSRFKAY
jgi:hypothetical protein